MNSTITEFPQAGNEKIKKGPQNRKPIIMSTLKFEGETPDKDKRQAYPADYTSDELTIEELIESIKNKIKRIQERNGAH